MQNNFEEELTGDFIILRKMQMADAESIYTWRASKSGQFLRQPDGYSIKMQEAWINSRGNDEINYIIIEKKTSESVGMIAIYDINHHDGIANVGRLLLAEKWLAKSNPYGLESLKLTQKYVFDGLNFRKVTGDIMAKNSLMFKLQMFLGMKQEGYLKKHTVVNGVAEDLYVMSLFADDFSKYVQKIDFLLKPFFST